MAHENQPQDFELFELLFKEQMPLSFLDLKDTDGFYTYKNRLQSFIDQIPSYLHSVGQSGFFPSFFFGSFRTSLNTQLISRLKDRGIDIKKLKYLFSTKKQRKNNRYLTVINTLKVVAQTDKNTHVFVFAEGEIPHKFNINEWKKITGKDYVVSDKSKLKITHVIINKKSKSKSKSENGKKITVSVENNLEIDHENKFTGTSDFIEIKKLEALSLEDQIVKLATSDKNKVEDPLKTVLEHVKKAINQEPTLNLNKDNYISYREAVHQAVLSGTLFNCRYRYNTRIYMEKIAGRGYADIILLVLGKQRITNAVPVVLELKVGDGVQEKSNVALEQAKGYIKHIDLLTTSQDVVAVGLNFDQLDFINQEVVTRPTLEPLMSRLVTCLKSYYTNSQTNIDGTIKQIVQDTYDMLPGVSATREDGYFSRFIVGQSILLEDYKKHIVQKSNKGISILLVPKPARDPAILIDLVEDTQAIKNNLIIDQNLVDKRSVISLELFFNTKKRNKFENYCTVTTTSHTDGEIYNNGKTLRTSLVEIPDVPKWKEKFNSALNSHKEIKFDSLEFKKVASTDKYQVILSHIAKSLYSAKFLVKKESDFQAILHGIWKYYGDLQRLNNKVLVLVEFQPGGGGRVDMVINGISMGSSDTQYTPVALELKFEGKQETRQKGVTPKKIEQQKAKYAEGKAWKSIFEGDTVAVMRVTYHNQAKDDKALISSSDTFTLGQVLHSSIIQSKSNPPSGGNVQDTSNMNIEGCLGSSRHKRSTKAHGCLISWDDVDKFNTASQEDARDIDKVKISSNKFLDYIKIQDKDKSAQLLEFVNERIMISDDNIVGTYTNQLNDVIINGGYDNYIQNERINSLVYDLSGDHSKEINPKLKQKLLNAAGRIQLIRGVHATLATCKSSDVKYCALSVSGLAYSFLAQPIEKAIVRITPNIIIRTANSIGKVVPRVLGVNTKFAIQLIGAKYGTKVAKGVAGGIGGVFDIIDIGISSAALVNCANRHDTNNPCSDKEIRDNIASISFSSVSFISGVALTAAGAPVAATGVGLVIIVAYATYSGVSSIIEHEKKYDTTHDENWSIFWRTVLFQDMARDIRHLSSRQDIVNNITIETWEKLESSPLHVVAYATGLGIIKLSSYTEKCKSNVEFDKLGITIQVRCFENKLDHREPGFHRSYAMINMIKAADTSNLSRVIPNHINNNATMICLPKYTGLEFEKNIRNSVSTATHYCDNSIAIAHNQRQKLPGNNKFIIYDLKYIKSGVIVGSNELHNIFLLYDSTAELFGGNNRHNEFVFLSSKFAGNIKFMDNSTNVIDVSNLTHDNITVQETDEIEFTGYSSTYTRYKPETSYGAVTKESFLDKNLINIDVKLLLSYSIGSNLMDVYPKLHYLGRRYKVDVFYCKTHQVYGDRIFVDGGGGNNEDKKDLIENCGRVVLRPFTEVTGGNGIYTLYVKTKGYENQVSSSTIGVHGNGTIVFPGINLLKDSDRITYSPTTNTVSFSIPLGQNGTFTLNVKNYLAKNNNTNFELVDQHNGRVTVKLDHDASVVNKFSVHIKHPLDNFSLAEDYYNNLYKTNSSYEVFGIVDGDDNKQAVFGSIGHDIIALYSNIIFAKGGEGEDVYSIVNPDLNDRIIVINNESNDQKLDIISLASVPIDDIALEQYDNDLILFINKSFNNIEKGGYIIIKNYFLGIQNQHLIFIDGSGGTFIPFQLNDSTTPIPFYRVSNDRNVFVLPVHIHQVIVDTKLEKLEFYRDRNHLLLIERKIINDVSPFTLVVQEFYSNVYQRANLKIYPLNYNGYNDNYIDLFERSLNATDYRELNYIDIFKEYIVDFSKSIELYHNQKLNISDNLHHATKLDEETIGIMIFKNVFIEHIVANRDSNDLIFSNKNSNYTISIKNWYASDNYKIAMLEFDATINPIRIYTVDNNNIQQKINDASSLNKIRGSHLDVDTEYHLKCLISINSLGIDEAYIALGFISIQDQINFIQNCDFKASSTTRLQNRIESLLPIYRDTLILMSRLKNKGYHIQEIQKNICNNRSNEIIQFMKDIQNPLLNIQKVQERKEEIFVKNVKKDDFFQSQQSVPDIVSTTMTIPSTPPALIRDQISNLGRTKRSLVDVEGDEYATAVKKSLSDVTSEAIISKILYKEQSEKLDPSINNNGPNLSRPRRHGQAGYPSQGRNIEEEYIPRNSATTLSSPINSFVNWLKDLGNRLVNLVKPTRGVTGNHEEIQHVDADTPFLLHNHIPANREIGRQIGTQHQQYEPTIGDHPDINGLLQLLNVCICKCTGRKLLTSKMDVSSNQFPIPITMGGYIIVDEFIEQLKIKAYERGLSRSIIDQALSSCDVHEIKREKRKKCIYIYDIGRLQKVIDEIEKRLNTGYIEDISRILSKEILEANMDRISFLSTPTQAKKLSQDIFNKLPEIMQQILEFPTDNHTIYEDRFNNGHIRKKSSNRNLSNESAKSRLDHLKEQMSAMHSSKIGSTSFPTVEPTDITPLNLIHNSNNFSEAI